MTGHWAKDCPLPQKDPYENNMDVCKGHVQYTTVESIPSCEIITTGVFLVNQQLAIVLFDSDASHSFINSTFVAKHGMKVVTLDNGGYSISATGNNISTNQLVLGAKIEIEGSLYDVDLMVLLGLGLDVILGMKWMSGNGVLIDTSTRVVMLRDPKDQQAFLVLLPWDVKNQNAVNATIAKSIADLPIVCEFPDVFPNDLLGFPLDQDMEFKIELVLCTAPISRRPYRMPPNELAELKTQLGELLQKCLIRPSSSLWGCPAIFVKKKD
jgi:hypothetical protein